MGECFCFLLFQALLRQESYELMIQNLTDQLQHVCCDYYVLTGSIIAFGRISKCRSMQTRCHCSLIKESTLYSKHIAVLNIAFIGLSDAVYQCRAIEH